MSEPREWKGVQAIQHDVDMFGYNTTRFPAGQFIHVVEASALDDLRAENKRLREALEHAVRALRNIASKRFTNRDVYAAATLRELGEECPKWFEGVRAETTEDHEMAKLINGLKE